MAYLANIIRRIHTHMTSIYFHSLFRHNHDPPGTSETPHDGALRRKLLNVSTAPNAPDEFIFASRIGSDPEIEYSHFRGCLSVAF